MALVASGTQRITNTAPAISGYPCSVGAWYRPAGTGAFGAIWHLARAADDGDRLALYQWNTNQYNSLVSVGGGDTSNLAGTVTASAWQFVIARFISATNRRIAVLNTNGSTAHAQSTGSATPATLTQLNIAGSAAGNEPVSGMIAELWYANADIQIDGAQLQDSTLRQLAYGGPFSVPNIASNIIEWRSFRKHPFHDEVGEVYYGGVPKQVWAPTGTLTTGIHPPLPYWYEKPGQSKTVLTI